MDIADLGPIAVYWDAPNEDLLLVCLQPFDGVNHAFVRLHINEDDRQWDWLDFQAGLDTLADICEHPADWAGENRTGAYPPLAVLLRTLRNDRQSVN